MPALLSIRARIAALVLLPTLLIGVLAAAVTMNITSGVVGRADREHCRQVAGMLAGKTAADYQAGVGALREFATRITRGDSLLYVRVMKPDGTPIVTEASRLWTDLGMPVPDSLPARPAVGQPLYHASQGRRPAHFDITWPVSGTDLDERNDTGSTRLLGYVRLGISCQQTQTDLANAHGLLVALATVLAATVIPAGLFAVRRLVAPLIVLRRTLARFAEGELDARSDIKRTDEVGDLARMYNLMAERLAQKHAEITTLNAELEERVQQRTRQLRELASRDPLTGLYNRRHFQEVLAGRFAEACRYGTELSCIMLDLDNFKTINDTYGHKTGDDLLILAAITLTTHLRTADVAARFGGDEFIILLPQTDLESAFVMAERVHARLNAAFAEHLPHCVAGASLGVACLSDADHARPDALVQAADRALYDAKSQGKNTIACRRLPVREPS